MKKDIEIPEVENVYIAAIREFNEEFQAEEWNVYIINNGAKDLEMVLIVSEGKDKKRSTSVMRHKIEKLPSKTFAKVEYLQDDVLALDNEFKVSYFLDSKMHDKAFIFKKNTIKESNSETIPLIPKKGVLAN